MASVISACLGGFRFSTFLHYSFYHSFILWLNPRPGKNTYIGSSKCMCNS